jgi:hypothetical protein
MNTQTHLLLASAVLIRDRKPATIAAVLTGALAPDISIFILFVVAQIQGIGGEALWDGLYWEEPWQTLSAISNSFPLYTALAAAGLLLRRSHAAAGRLLLLFSMAALLHLGTDFFLHASDAHRHFWPLTDWRFFSPVSYWDPAYFGLWVAAAEAALGLGLVIWHWRRYRHLVTRALLVICAFAYLGVPLFFILSFMQS